MPLFSGMKGQCTSRYGRPPDIDIDYFRLYSTPDDGILQHRLVVEALADVIEESGGHIDARNESARATSDRCNVPLLPPKTAATC